MLGHWLRDHGLAQYLKLEPVMDLEVMDYTYSEEIYSAIEELDVSSQSVNFNLVDVDVVDERTWMATLH